ncbi:MAG: methionine--tRNA ligase, partial [Deltaproteobacteria bacterium]|nr:methionine--tRNA ligase [Deltaproteobacteria bacterium]
ERYTAEEMIGKQVIVVANLKPAKLMGVVSNGMLLAAVDDSGPTLATVEKTLAPGTTLK